MADTRRTEPEHLVVGHVARAHGTRGEVFVQPLTDRIDQVFGPGREVMVEESDEPDAAEFDEPLVIEEVRPFKTGVLVKFEGIDDRNTSELLARRYLQIPAEAAAPLEEGEVFYHQLIGLDVVTEDGRPVGKVKQIYETGPTELLEIRTPSGTILIPFTERIVSKIDLEAGTLTISPPEGLLDV